MSFCSLHYSLGMRIVFEAALAWGILLNITNTVSKKKFCVLTVMLFQIFFSSNSGSSKCVSEG